MFSSTKYFLDDVRQFVELEVAIDTPPPPPLLKLTNLIPMTLSSGPTPPVLLLQDPVLVKVLTMMLDVDWTLFNFWLLFCRPG